MAKRPTVVLIGASGHAKVVIDAIERNGHYRIALLLDDNSALHGKPFFGYKVAGATESILAMAEKRKPWVLVSIGDNAARARIAAWPRAKGFRFASAVHPDARIGRGAGPGASGHRGRRAGARSALRPLALLRTGRNRCRLAGARLRKSELLDRRRGPRLRARLCRAHRLPPRHCTC